MCQAEEQHAQRPGGDRELDTEDSLVQVEHVNRTRVGNGEAHQDEGKELGFHAEGCEPGFWELPQATVTGGGTPVCSAR